MPFWKRTNRPKDALFQTNEQWVSALRGDSRDRALTQLRPILVRGIQPILERHGVPDAHAFAQDMVQDSLLRILDGIEGFRGDSKFTTWAHKICVRVCLSELRRSRWQDVSLDQLLASGGDAAAGGLGMHTGPEGSADHSTEMDMVMGQVKQAMEQRLTERQRTAIELLMVHEMPIGEVARRLDTNRNALYKLVHDARKKMKMAMAEKGLDVEDLIGRL